MKNTFSFRNFFFLALLLSVAKNGFSQAPIVLPPFGHTSFASDFDIDADSKTIATVGIDGHIVLWDIATQKAFKKVRAHVAECYSIRYSWNGDYIVTSSVDGTVNIFDKNLKLVNTIKTGSSNLFAELDRTEKKLAVACADGHLRVYEFPSLKNLFDINTGTSKLNFSVFSTNSRLVFTGNDEGMLLAYDIENDGKSLLSNKLDAAVKMVSFDWAGSAMIIHTMNGMGEVLLLPSFKSLGRLPVPTMDYKSGAAAFVSNMDISPNSKYLAFANANGQVQFVTGETLVKVAGQTGVNFETTTLPLPHKKFISKVKFSPDMKYMVTLGHDMQMCAVEIKDVDLSKLTDQFVGVKVIKQYSDYVRSIYFDEDKNIHMRGFHTYTWNLKSGDHYTENISVGREKFLRTALKKVLMGKREVFYDANRDIILIDEDGKLTDPEKITWSKNRKSAAFEWKNKMFRLDAASNSIIELYPIPWKEKPSAIVYAQSGELAYSIKEEVFALNSTGKKLWSKKMEKSVAGMDISFDDKKIAVGHYGESLPVFSLQDGKEIASVKTLEAESQTVCFMPGNNLVAFTGYWGSIGMMDLTEKKKQTIITTDDNDVFAMGVSDDGKMLATIGNDRLIKLYSVEIKKPVFEVFTMYESGMAVLNADNYYMSDKRAYKELGFAYNGKIYTGDQFDAQFNRPDLVLASSPYADAEYVNVLSATWKKRMKRLGLGNEKTQQSTTALSLNNQNQIKTNIKEQQIHLELNVSDSLNDVSALLVTVNDVPIYGREGMKINHKSASKNSNISLDLALLPEKNTIKITAVDSRGQISLPELIEVNCFAKEESQLYLVSVGTSKYKDDRFNLNYAAKDANDMAELFKSNSNFSKINELVLTDEKVTVKNFNEIRTFLKKARSNDVVMVFVAGHGVLDTELNYYLASNETNFLKPSEGGIKYEELEKMFDGIAAIRKTLFIDACHSGELDKDEIALGVAANTTKDENVMFRSSGAGVLTGAANKQTSLLVKELFADMRMGTGATVLSSAGGAEYAIESSEYKNGLFTFSVIEGLKTKAADQNGDGKIMLSELQQYVSARVSELSKGKQKPTSRSENLSMDFRIW